MTGDNLSPEFSNAAETGSLADVYDVLAAEARQLEEAKYQSMLANPRWWEVIAYMAWS